MSRENGKANRDGKEKVTNTWTVGHFLFRAKQSEIVARSRGSPGTTEACDSLPKETSCYR